MTPMVVPIAAQDHSSLDFVIFRRITNLSLEKFQDEQVNILDPIEVCQSSIFRSFRKSSRRPPS